MWALATQRINQDPDLAAWVEANTAIPHTNVSCGIGGQVGTNHCVWDTGGA